MSSHEQKGPGHALKIIEDVIDLPRGERVGALLQACSDDRELLEEALSILWMSLEVAEVETPAFAPLRSTGGAEGPDGPGLGAQSAFPGASEADAPDVDEEGDRELGSAIAGSSIGPFRILHELGHGGMGTVYLAEQRQPIRRRVAIKVAREWLDQGARLRLAAERQAMARLSHENVARLYEAGATGDGHPYFAMEYVEGDPLTTYCDAARLSIEERLRLFLEVCAGVEHAHRNGIIHRDLKPSNILVAEAEDGARPKVIDFGIAKATDGRLHEKSLLTGQAIVGTPAYLSPEAIADPDAVDTRSDVYSLGVLLQELLIGVRLVPEVEGESAITLLRRVLEEDPPPILRRWRKLDPVQRLSAQAARGLDRGDLEQKIRGDLEWIVGRASARAQDDRYSSVAELAADVKRHLEHQPVLAGPPSTVYQLRKLVRRHRATFAFSILVLLSLVGGLVARTIEADRAQRLAAEAIQAREETEEVVDYLTDLFVSADPHESLGQDPTATELLGRGVERLESEAFDERPAIRARLLHTTARVLRRLGRVEASQQSAERALEIRRRVLPGSGELAETLALVGGLARDADDHERAEELLREALALREATSGLESIEASSVMVELSAAFEESDRVEEALPLAQRALAIEERELGARDPRVLGILNNLARLAQRSGQIDEAEKAYRRSLELKREVLPPNHPDLALTLVNLGNLLAFRETEEAAALFREARAIEEQVLGPEHPDLAITLNSLGSALRNLGQWEDSEEAFERALAIFEKVRGPEHAHVGVVLYNLGRVSEARGDLRAAEARHRRALGIREKGGPAWAMAESLLRLAKVERLDGDLETAGRLLEAAQGQMAGEAGSPKRRFLAAERGWLALTAAELGAAELDAAEVFFREATDGDATENETAAEAHGEALKGWARLAYVRGEHDEAKALARQSLEVLETVFAPKHSSLEELKTLIEQINRQP